MALSELYSGTHAVDTTEWSLTTDLAFAATANATDGIYQLFLDVNDMVAGDILQIRLYEKCRAADTQRLVNEWILTGVQSSPSWVSDAFQLMHGWDFTCDALAGTITVLWSVRRVGA